MEGGKASNDTIQRIDRKARIVFICEENKSFSYETKSESGVIDKTSKRNR